MYTVSKISVTTRHADGSAIYEYEFSYSSWAALRTDLHRRARYANEVFMGRGANVFRDGVVIGHTDNFDFLDEPINRVSLRMFLSQVAEEAEPVLEDA